MSTNSTAPELDYAVTIRTRDGEEAIKTVAASMNFALAMAAFEEALKTYPKERIALHLGKKVLRERLLPGQNDLGTDFS